VGLTNYPFYKWPSAIPFTALDGLLIGTRCEALDAGVVPHLIQQKGMSADALVDLLYRRSGMLGLSLGSPRFP
jgi:acetate kinase